MKTGKVVSYSDEKSYGFIRDETGESVFFHKSGISKDSQGSIKTGCGVAFELVPSPKGNKAVNVVIAESYPIYSEPLIQDDVIVSKSEACGRQNEVVFKHVTVFAESQSPDAAVSELKRKAKACGCNALLSLAREARTGTSLHNINHNYTIHRITACLALVKRVEHTARADQAQRSRAEVDAEIERIKGAPSPGDSRAPDGAMFHFIMGFVTLSIICLFVWLA